MCPIASLKSYLDDKRIEYKMNKFIEFEWRLNIVDYLFTLGTDCVKANKCHIIAQFLAAAAQI